MCIRDRAEYIYQNGILKDMDAADIGRVWLFPTSVYLEEIEESSCEISINLYRYDPKSDSYEYDGFSTYMLSSSTHTRQCLEKFNLLR